jgi:hypothetical protein
MSAAATRASGARRKRERIGNLLRNKDLGVRIARPAAGAEEKLERKGEEREKPDEKEVERLWPGGWSALKDLGRSVCRQ